jgi:hypothetical protein
VVFFDRHGPMHRAIVSHNFALEQIQYIVKIADWRVVQQFEFQSRLLIAA